MFYKEPNFKETTVGKIPEDWDVVKLIDICELIRGTEPGSKTYNKARKGYRFIRVSDISKQILEGVFVDENPNNLVFCTKDNILLVLDGVPGVVAKGFEGAVSSGIRVIKPKTNDINKDFLFYILQHEMVQRIIENYTTGTTIKHSSRAVNFITISFTSLHEQEIIAEILSTVDKALGKTDEVIAKIERLKTGLIRELLTKGIGHKEYKETEIGKTPKEWGVEPLEKVCAAIVDCPHSTPKFTSKGVLIIRNFNIRDGELHLEPVYYTTEEEWFVRTRRCIPQNGDVLFSREAPIGEASLAPESTRFSLGQRTMMVRPNKTLLNPLFLLYAIYSPFIRRQLRNLEAGVTAHHVNVADIRTLKIPVPVLKEQERIASIISAVSEKLKLERKKKAKLERIKRGLMDLLLTGKVRVKVD